MPKVSDEHKQAVRQNIIDAAHRIIDRDGLAKLTTRAIIDEAGVSNGTLYHYFPSIDHLFAELAEARLLDAMDGIVAPTEDAERGPSLPAIERMVGWLQRDFLGDRELAKAIAEFRGRISLGDEQRDAVEGLSRYAVREFGGLMRQMQADGEVRADLDGDALIEMIDLLWDGLGRRLTTDSFQTSYDRTVSVIVDVLLRGILA